MRSTRNPPFDSDGGLRVDARANRITNARATLTHPTSYELLPNRSALLAQSAGRPRHLEGAGRERLFEGPSQDGGVRSAHSADLTRYLPVLIRVHSLFINL